VTPISTSTEEAGPAIPAGYAPDALAISSSGQVVATSGATAYVVSSIAGTVTPLPAASGRAGAPLSVGLGSYPTDLVVSGSTAVVVDSYAGQVSLIDTATGHVFAPVTVGNYPVAVAISG
jgi:YVTN family beta-propeller protein